MFYIIIIVVEMLSHNTTTCNSYLSLRVTLALFCSRPAANIWHLLGLFEDREKIF